MPVVYDMCMCSIVRPQGEKLTHGAEAGDYAVIIGDRMCGDLELTQNDIVCIPPEEQPQSLMGKEYPEVVVSTTAFCR